MTKGVVATVAALCVVVLVAAQLHGAAAEVICNPSELNSCVPAVIGDQIPTAECCRKLKEQVPCFCKYIREPMLKAIIENPKAGEVTETCGVIIPQCPLL